MEHQDNSGTTIRRTFIHLMFDLKYDPVFGDIKWPLSILKLIEEV
jgi:hypothetical protein